MLKFVVLKSGKTLNNYTVPNFWTLEEVFRVLRQEKPKNQQKLEKKCKFYEKKNDKTCHIRKLKDIP